MPFRIQRVPRGLGNVLSIFGGETPQLLAEEVHGSLDLMQAYGLSQRQVFTFTAAAQTTGGQAIGTPSVDRWCILHAAFATVDANVGLTALAASIGIIRGTAGPSILVAYEQMNPVIAQNFSWRLCWQPSYCWLLPPGSQIFVLLNVLTGIANTAISVTAEVGILD